MDMNNCEENQLSNDDTKTEPPNNLSELEKPKSLGQRHVMVTLIFFAMGLGFGIRIIIYAAIVAMIDNSDNPKFPQVDWDEATRGIIFGCNFWGVFLATTVAGIISQKYGAKVPMFISIFGMSVLAIAAPFIATISWIWMCVRQVVEGIFGGFVIATSHYLFGKWVHPSERTLLVPIAITGIVVGKIVSLGATGFIASSSLGWPASFYIPGVFGIIWSILWWIYASDSPLTNTRISNEERAFLETIPGIMRGKQATPWKQILSSKPVWVLIISQCAQNWSYIMLLVSMPQYMHAILLFNVKSSALLTALPYAITLVTTFIISPVSTWLIQKGHTSVASSRKIFNSVGMWIPAVCLIVLGFVPDRLYLALFLIVAAISLNGAIISGFSISHLDLSPNFSGILSSLITCIGATMSIISPMYFGFVVKDIHDPFLWRILFLTGSVSWIIGNFVFVIFGDWNVQEWNDLKEKSEKVPA